MMRVCYVDLSRTMTPNHPRHILPSMDIMSCAAIMQQRGHHVTLVDMNLDGRSQPELETQVRTDGCELLVLKPTLSTLEMSFQLAHRLRPIVQRIVVTGPLCDMIPERLLVEGSPVDGCLLGDAETATFDLADGKELDACRGVAVRGEGQIIRREADLIRQLDELPIPLHELYLDRGYQFHYPVRLARPLRPGFILSSRGCPHGCIFCSAVERASVGKPYRCHSAERVVAEMTLLEKRGVNTIYFLDDNFLHDRKRVMELCRRIQEAKLKLTWACEARPSDLDEPLARAMKDAGCTTVCVGMESGSDRVLQFMRKGFSTAEAVEGMQAAQRAGLWVVAFVILGAPVETDEDREATYRQVRELMPELVQAHLYAKYEDCRWNGAWDVLSKFDYECHAAPGKQRELVRFYRRYYLSLPFLFGPALRQVPYLLANLRIKLPLAYKFLRLLWSGRTG